MPLTLVHEPSKIGKTDWSVEVRVYILVDARAFTGRERMNGAGKTCHLVLCGATDFIGDHRRKGAEKQRWRIIRGRGPAQLHGCIA